MAFRNSKALVGLTIVSFLFASPLLAGTGGCSAEHAYCDDNDTGDDGPGDSPSGQSGCEKCVIGLDNKAYCKDPRVYAVASGELRSPCYAGENCYYMPGAGTYCEPACSGNVCYVA